MRTIRLALLSSVVAATHLLSAVAFAADLPAGYQPVSGSSSYATSADGNSGTLTATTAASIGNWGAGFNVASGKTFTANLPAGGAHLSRDITASPSQIFGSLNVPSGRFFLVNTNGITFSSTAQVNAAGLVASSLDILNSDFNAQNYRFSRTDTPASVRNAGRITSGAGGATLIGSSVENTGVILARGNQINLASGDTVSLTIDANGEAFVNQEAGTSQAPSGASSAVRNAGTLRAEGGHVFLVGDAAGAVFSRLVNQEGIVEATAVNGRGGSIQLIGTGDAGSVRNAGHVTPQTYLAIRSSGTIRSEAPLNGPFSLQADAVGDATFADIGTTTRLSDVYVTASGMSLGQVRTTGDQGYWQRPQTELPSINEIRLRGSLSNTLNAISLYGKVALAASVAIDGGVYLYFFPGVETFSGGGYPIGLSGPYDLSLTAARQISFSGAWAPVRGTEYQGYDVAVRNFTATSDRFFGSVRAQNGIDIRANWIAPDMPDVHTYSSVLSQEGFFSEGSGVVHIAATNLTDQDGGYGSGGFHISTRGPVTLIGNYTGNGPVDVTGSSVGAGIRWHGEIRTEGNVAFRGPVTLLGDSYVGTGAGPGNILFTSTVNATSWGADELTLQAGGGDITMNGVGHNFATGTGTRLGRLTVLDARNATFNGHVTPLSFAQRAGTGTTTFKGRVNTYDSWGINLRGTHFAFNGPVQTTGAGPLVVTNSGTLTFGPSADMRLDGAFVQDGTGPVRLAGDIRTTDDSITFNRPVMLTGDVFLGTGRANGGNITFNSTVYGLNSGQEDLTLETGTGDVNMNGQVGWNPATGVGVRLGRVLATLVRNWNAGNVTAASIAQAEGTGTSSFGGTLRTNQATGIVLTGNNFNLNGAEAVGGSIAVNYRGYANMRGTYSPAVVVKKRA